MVSVKPADWGLCTLYGRDEGCVLRSVPDNKKIYITDILVGFILWEFYCL